ncbi:YqzM family protein [Paenibacillus sp. HB172176]|nr:YqzM family protein [Paenibacillus sp. HB172176]
MENVRDPREHLNEEPRDDLMDVMFGFGGMLGFMTLVFVIAVVVKLLID